MMNRGVLQRQMFANGGQAVPNEYKGFSKLPEDVQMRMDPVAAKKYQEGGPVEQGVGSMMQMPADPSQAAPVDPQIVEGLLTDAASEVQDLENVDNYETMINTIRGDELPMEARREELAELVGPEDAAQTPDSVLALAQPAIVMASVDEGIGGLAQAEMTQEVSGPMAGGIMSTVAPPQPEMAAAPPAAPGPEMMGGPPPVNFNQGGLVRRGDNQPVKLMQAGGDPFAGPGRLAELARERMAVREGLIGDPAGRLQEQKDLTKSQMLFDIANTALAFAAPMQGETAGLSAAERLAMAAQQTQLPQTIGARAAQLGEFKTGLAKEKQALQLAALGSAETALAAEAKAAEEIKLQNLRAAQESAKLELENKLDTALQTSLKQMGITAESSLEDQKQAGRVALEKVEQGNRIDIEQLKATGRQSDLVLANELEQENIILRGNIKLGQMGVANEYDLAKMDKSHEQATELNNTNNALQEKLSGLDREISERRLALDEKKAEVAAAQGERKLELQAEANAMEADLNAFTMNYKTEKLDLERAAARLTRLGTSTEARITTLISDPESLAKYAAGTMGPEETLEFNQSIAYYNAPKQVWDEKSKRFVLSPGNPLSNELMSSIQIRQENGLTIPNIKLDKTVSEKTQDTETEVKSAITEGLSEDALNQAFGSLPFAKSFANDVIEAFSFGAVGAPYKASKDAITAAETLNTRTVQVFQKSADLRESVTQLNLLIERTPSPSSFFTGPEKAASKVKAVLGMIADEKALLEKYLESDKYPMGSDKYMEATTALDKLNQLEAGYKVFSNAYERTSNRDAKLDAFNKDLGLGKYSTRRKPE